MYKLFIGIHRGTMISRDSEPVKERQTLEECQREAIEAFKDYARMGCYCWFCYALTPDNERVTLVESVPYDVEYSKYKKHNPNDSIYN